MNIVTERRVLLFIRGRMQDEQCICSELKRDEQCLRCSAFDLASTLLEEDCSTLVAVREGHTK